MSNEGNKPLWWQTGVIYQIYPRSFQDSNDDGIGDLKGIVDRLDYLTWLGVNAIWISPFFVSPMADFGYDISDYKSIDPIFGHFDDFENLLAEAHNRGMKLIIDLVPNHTSDQHPWFQESRSDRHNPKRDWYIWRDAGPDQTPPNNWLSVFGGSAWEWDKQTQQYYYHAFLKEQPDLNWRNPEVQQALHDVMKFWLEKGVDGFRVDVMWHMIKDQLFRDNPKRPEANPASYFYDDYLPVYSTDQPEVHEVVREMRKLMDQFEERVLIGEIYLPIDRLVAYYGEENNGAHLPFNFQLLTIDWEAEKIANMISQYEGALPAGGWPNWVLGNHDQPRIASKIGLPQARVAAMMLFTLRGTPTIYYGEEIGMVDVAIPPTEIVDPQGIRFPDLYQSRDPARTPMQWDTSPYSGFSNVKPWLRLADNYEEVNVETQKSLPESLVNLYHTLIQLRHRELALQLGSYQPIHTDEQIISYLRSYEGEGRFLVILNLTHRPTSFSPAHFYWHGTIVVDTLLRRLGEQVGSESLTVQGDEGLIIRLQDEAED